MLFGKYFPFEYKEDVQSIDYDMLYKRGVRGLIFDIDNTLVPHGADSTPEVDEFFRKIHQKGFKTLLLSNNSEARILRFKKNIDTLYIYDANKPAPGCFLKAVEMLKLHKDEVVVIGDTTFTDIVGANNAGIASILVKYIGYYKHEWKGFKRYIENVILWLYAISNKNHRLGL